MQSQEELSPMTKRQNSMANFFYLGLMQMLYQIFDFCFFVLGNPIFLELNILELLQLFMLHYGIKMLIRNRSV